MAGMELDLERVRGGPLTLAIRGWGVSLVLRLAAAALLYILPKVHSLMMVGLALSTTALGTLLPSCGLLSSCTIHSFPFTGTVNRKHAPPLELFSAQIRPP